MLGRADIGVRAIRYDSRLVDNGDLFVAVNGRDDRGIAFAPDAVAAGARVVVTDALDEMPRSVTQANDVTLIVVENARLAMAELAHRMAGDPARRLRLFGITGTNGKTTGAFVLRQLLAACGERVGLIGTLGAMIDVLVPTGYTTPESPELATMLAEMVDAGCTSVVMEVSSHALALERVAGLHFEGALFTNLTQDHLDFHGTMEEYGRTKKRFFDRLSERAHAVVNIDDPGGELMLRDTRAGILRYGAHPDAEARIQDVRLASNGSRWRLDLPSELGGPVSELTTPLLGAFNVWNVTAALVAALASGFNRDTLLGAVAGLQAVPGRMQAIALGNGATAVIDYAHTPDALENVLASLVQLRARRITAVFGCGGDRDRGKRPLMGEAAARIANRLILTSDNPRSEDPEAIIDDIVRGLPPATEFARNADRGQAIESALNAAEAGDVVLIAGKGHENYQIIGGERRHFDDSEVVRQWIARQRSTSTEAQ